MGHIPKLRLQIQFFEPAFPDIDNYQTEYGPVATSSVFPVSVITVCIILAIILCIIFILDISNNSLSYRMLLLILFFLFTIVEKTSSSMLGYYCGFTERFDIVYLQGIYVLPICVYIAVCLTKWRKYSLLGCSLLLFLYNVIRTVAEGSADWYYVSSQAGEFLLFVATGVFFIAECIWGNKRFRKIIRLKYIFCRWLNCYH